MAGRKPKITEGNRARICARWLNGEGITALSREHKVHYDTVKKIIRDAGLSDADRSNLTGETDKQRSESLAAYAAIPDPDPNDPLDQADWLFKLAVTNARLVANDRNYKGSESDRRRELSQHATTAQKLMPLATLRKAKRQMEKDAAAMEEGASPDVEEIAED